MDLQSIDPTLGIKISFYNVYLGLERPSRHYVANYLPSKIRDDSAFAPPNYLKVTSIGGNCCSFEFCTYIYDLYDNQMTIQKQ